MPALDGLRGIAIVLVILTHAAEGSLAPLTLLPGGFPVDTDAPVLPHWFSLIASGASHGVQLFFVVSAFTLTLRGAQGRRGLASYAVRRVARIGPGFWAAALFYTLLGGMGPRFLAPAGIGVGDILLALGFAGAWQGGAALAVVPGGWSVSCEALFYIALPLLLWLSAGRVWRMAALTAVVIAVTAVLTRRLMLNHTWTFALYASPASQAAVFLCGITAALVAQRIPNRLPAACVTILLGILVFAIPFSPVPDWIFPHHILFGIVSACAVGLAATRAPAWLASQWAGRVGELSYSMYLTHFALLGPSLAVAAWLAPHDPLAMVVIHFAITLVSSVAVSAVTYAVIERPAIRWAARLARPVTAPAPATR